MAVESKLADSTLQEKLLTGASTANMDESMSEQLVSAELDGSLAGSLSHHNKAEKPSGGIK